MYDPWTIGVGFGLHVNSRGLELRYSVDVKYVVVQSGAKLKGNVPIAPNVVSCLSRSSDCDS